jgi:hypothetical protein
MCTVNHASPPCLMQLASSSAAKTPYGSSLALLTFIMGQQLWRGGVQRSQTWLQKLYEAEEMRPSC